jgi:hypothetical protein
MCISKYFNKVPDLLKSRRKVGAYRLFCGVRYVKIHRETDYKLLADAGFICRKAATTAILRADITEMMCDT